MVHVHYFIQGVVRSLNLTLTVAAML